MCHKARTSMPSQTSILLNPNAPIFFPGLKPKPEPVFPHQRYAPNSPPPPHPVLLCTPQFPVITSYFYPFYLLPQKPCHPTKRLYGPDPVSKPGKVVKKMMRGEKGRRDGSYYVAKKRGCFVPPRFRGSDGNIIVWECEKIAGNGGGHKWKPKKKFDLGFGGDEVDSSSSCPQPLEDGEECDNKKTSVMIKNIPNQYCRNELLDFLDMYCREHQLSYDFAYLPMDFKRHYNLGYAFVNFTTTNAAKKFHELLNGYKWGKIMLRKGCFTSTKVCAVTWAKIQGKQGLVDHFKNSNFRCLKKEYLPVELTPPSKGNSLGSRLTTVGRYWRAA